MTVIKQGTYLLMEQAKCFEYSIIIPLLNEEHSLVELHRQIGCVMASLTDNYEIIFIDDGSTDQSYKVLLGIHAQDKKHTNVIKLKTNVGKATALQIAFEQAQGKVFITMDADLQDSPNEIPKFITALNENVDLVSGWKKRRYDPISKTLPSKLFNWVVRKISRVALHDFNCGFKAYRREIFDSFTLYGELHRYIPVLAYWQGFSVSEVIVEHKPRIHGKSKYGFTRLIKGFFDLMTILITHKYVTRPLHVFGTVGLLSVTFGFFALTYLSYLWLFGFGPIGNRPLLLFGMLAVLFGGQLVSFGLLAEMVTKSENNQKTIKMIDKIITASATKETLGVMDE